MRISSKWALGIGVAAVIGATFWMRELASWRPVTLTNFGFQPAHLRVSRDGKQLLAENGERTYHAILNLKSGEADYDLRRIRAFDKSVGVEAYPRVWLNRPKRRYFFSVSLRQSIELKNLVVTNAMTNQDVSREDQGVSVIFGEDAMLRPNGELRFGWSNVRREVYGEVDAIAGEIWIWDWDSGKLKRRVRYAQSGHDNAVFSPDGKWMLATDSDKMGNSFLRRYDVQTGKKVEIINQALQFPAFGFSPDDQCFWFCQGSGGKVASLNLLRASDFKFLWAMPSPGPVKWLPDGRIGFVRQHDFQPEISKTKEHRNSRVLPGPFYDGTNSTREIEDWVFSPDGKWIYSAEQSGVIRRWRAK